MTSFCAYLCNLFFKLSLMFLRFIHVNTFNIPLCDSTTNYLSVLLLMVIQVVSNFLYYKQWYCEHSLTVLFGHRY